MEPVKISKQQARQFILAHQALWPPYQLEGKAGILEYIHRVGCIQFDPLNIAGHNQELALQARVRDFRPQWLQELLYQERRLLDGWDKNMSIYCLEDWPYFRRNHEGALRHLGADTRPVNSILPEVRREFEQRGPLSSADLNYDQRVDWSWAPTRLSRAALESMYFWGELVIHHKVRTRRVYDLASRHIPHKLLAAEEPNPSEESYHDWYVLRRVGSVGLLWNRAGDAWLGIHNLKALQRQSSFERLLARGALIEIQVDGISMPLYLRAEDRPVMEQVLTAPEPAPQAAILAPLDNLLWDRRLVRELFAFEYRWEVYKPQSERQYGYYVLPILYGDRLVARFEPGRDPKTKTLLIKHWWWEPTVQPREEICAAIHACFRRFCEFLSLERIVVSGSGSLDWLL